MSAFVNYLFKIKDHLRDLGVDEKWFKGGKFEKNFESWINVYFNERLTPKKAADEIMKKIKLKEALKSEIRKILKEEVEIDEMARIAKTLKIADKEAAQQVIEKFQGTKKTWIADMITKVIESGDEGIQQVALAKAVGKVDEFGDGRQQAINPEVRSLLNAGVFTYGEAGVKTEPKAEEPIAEPKPTKKAEPKVEPVKDITNDEEDVEVEDEYEKIDTEDQGEDEEELAKKAAPSKKVQSKASELDKVIKDMKKIAADYKKAKEAKDKEKEKELVDQLKEKTKLKNKLEKDIKVDLGDSADDDEDEEA